MIKIEQRLPPLKSDTGDFCSDLMSQSWSHASMLITVWAELSRVALRNRYAMSADICHSMLENKKYNGNKKNSGKGVGVSGQ